MKPRDLLLVAAAALGGRLRAQQLPVAQVPPAVKQAWQAKFPTARLAEWKLKSDHAYEAEFALNKVDIAAKFTPSGEWLETETTIREGGLTAAVRAAIGRDFKGYKVVESQRLDRAADPRLLWEVHLENPHEVVKAQFQGDGAVFAKSAKPKP